MEIDIKDFHHQLKSLKKAQPPTVFMTASIIMDSVLEISSLFMDILQPKMVSDTSRNSQARVSFIVIQKGSLLVLDYEIGSLDLDRHNPTLFPTKLDMVLGFIRGLVLPPYLASEYLIAAGFTFL